jgi:outer membrane protein assembly factor BamA
MRTCVVAVGFLFLLSALSAQPNSPSRAVRTHDLTMGGASKLPTTELAAIESELIRECCDHPETQEMRERMVYAFQERGYFEVRINQIEVIPTDPHTAPPAVDISADVSPGQRFQLKAIEFRGNETIANDRLREQFKIADGEVFNVQKIRQGLDDLRRLYVSQGFINFSPVPNTEADDASATVTLTIDVDEGRQFRLGGLLLDGEEPHAGDGAKLLEAWKPMEGRVYDGNKIEKWWQLATTMLPPGAKLERLLELRQDGTTAIVTARLNFPSAD